MVEGFVVWTDFQIVLWMLFVFTGGSEDGRSMPRLGDVGRSDSGEVEMTEFERPGPSSEETAGTRAGEASLTVKEKSTPWGVSSMPWHD